MDKDNNQKKRKILILVLILILLTITIVASIKLLPLFASLKDEQKRINFENYIDSLGIKGVLLILLIQILQIFVAFIPGEIVELIAGFLYGTLGGLAICLLGNIIGSFLIFLIVKIFAKKYMIKYQEKLKQYSFLNNRKKISLYLFLIYLIPGIPKDIITYLVPFLPISFTNFIIVTSIARIPSIVSSTYSSNAFLNNNYTLGIIVFALFAIIAILGFIFKDKIIAFLKKDSNSNDATKDN